MTRLKLIDIAKIKARNLKKFQSNPEESFKYSSKRFFSHQGKSESVRKELVDEIGKFEEASEKVRLSPSRYADMKKTGDALGIEDPNWFGKGTLTKVDPGAEAVEKYATGIEHKYQNQKLSKIRSTFKNVILGNKKKYTAPPPKVSLHKLDPARKDKTLSGLILNIRKESQPKFVLTPAGQDKFRQLQRAEGAAIKIASQKAQTFKDLASSAGLATHRSKDLEKIFIKSKMIKKPVTSETAIASGFPGKGSGYDPAGVSIIDDFTAEWGKSVHPKLKAPFAPWQTKEIAAWNKKPIVGQFVRPDFWKTKTINISSDQSHIGQTWTKQLGPATAFPKLRKIKRADLPTIRTKKIQQNWKQANQRLEKEFIKGLERKKSPFYWE